MTKGFSEDLYGGTPGRCYHSHPALKIKEFSIYGGSCGNPVVEDADIYVALQSGSRSGLASDPWDKQLVTEIHFSINDYCAPETKKVARFKKMIDWLCNQLQEGKKIHVGCIGGHGRTGLVLSAIVAQMGESDAIQYVRKHYCTKAVESPEQVKFLMKHYGVSQVDGAKERMPLPRGSSFSGFGSSSGKIDFGGSSYSSQKSGTLWDQPGPSKKATKDDRAPSTPTRTIQPVTSARNLWKKRESKSKSA